MYEGERRLVQPGTFDVTDKGLLLLSDEAKQRCARTTMSPSTMSSLQGCPARWAADKMIDTVGDWFSATELGSAAHSMFERLYKLPPERRTRTQAAHILSLLAYRAFPGDDPRMEAMRTLWTGEVSIVANGLFNLEDPQTIDIVDCELQIADATVSGVPIRLIIDRVRRNKQGRIVLDDYKTGKVPVIKLTGDKHGDQLRIYAAAYEEVYGDQVVEANVLYTSMIHTKGTGKAKTVSLSRSAMRKTLGAFSKTWDQVTGYCETSLFPYQPNNLCAWCPLANVCPVAHIESEKAILQAVNRPSAYELGIREDDDSGHCDVSTEPDTGSWDVSTVETIPSDEEGNIEMTKKVFEGAKGAVVMNGDVGGSTNAFMAANDLSTMAFRQLHYGGYKISRRGIKQVSTLLAWVVRTVQDEVSVQPDNSMNTYFNKSVRWALDSVLRATPIPLESSDPDDYEQWAHSAAVRVLAIINNAIGMVLDDDFPDDPWSVMGSYAKDEPAVKITPAPKSDEPDEPAEPDDDE